MNWINLILIFGMVLLLTYSAFSALLIGHLPISLSDTYYEMRRQRKGWIFTLTLISTAATLLPIWLDKTEGEWYQFLVFLSCVAVLFVAVTPDYKKDLERKIHYTAAYLACGSVIVYNIVSGNWPILIITMIPTAIALVHKEGLAFFAEIGLIMSIYLGLL